MVQRQVEEGEYIKKLVLDAIKHRCSTVKDIANYIKKSNPDVSFNAIKDAIRGLEKDKRIELSEQRFDGSFTDFVFSINTAFTLWLAIIVTGITLASIYILPQIEPFTMIRIIVGGLFVLFIPGYSLITLLFPKRIDIVERLALSIALSLAIVPLIGLILNYTPLGIRLEPVVSMLSIASTSMMLAAMYKQYEARKNG